jgi:integrase
MPRRPKDEARFLGPYWIESLGKWRATFCNPQAANPRHRRVTRHFADGDEAQNWVDEGRAKLQAHTTTTFKVALDAYEKHLAQGKGNKEVSVTETTRRVREFFGPVIEMRLGKLTVDQAGELYCKLDADGKVIGGFAARTYTVGSAKKKTLRQKSVSVDYHRHTLSQAKTFMVWCVGKGWISESPLAKVKGIGRRKKGKPKLSGDEARTFYKKCLELGAGGDEAALATAMLLTMALRQGDVLKRQVRDFDLDGTVLNIDEAKTEKSNRPRLIPKQLRPLLRQLVSGRQSLEPLFKADDGGFHTKSWLRLAMKKRLCPAAGVPYVPPHGLKGTSGKVLKLAGASSEAVADFLSHEDERTQDGHYVDGETAAAADQERFLTVLQGGRT